MQGSAAADWDLSRVEEILQRYGGRREALITILQDIQAQYNYLPPEVLQVVAGRMGVSLSRVYKVATFYKSFSLLPRGRHEIKVCMGTSCHLRGSQRILESLERDIGLQRGGTTEDLRFTLTTVNCVGACALSPVVVVDEDYHGCTTPSRIAKVLKKYR
ncbi:MAG: NADH-quinone oxidoreductase subunit NuoE [Deltaproteobacteria bacterium]|nr:NADH-quinone oxidoreductase subunit NuoE [Deltaproteobacteria bacterium]MBW2307041.1 NADH-quinone oxidoreductase subunit NuoE [Deltaproteobacteria bacterium]